MLNLFTIMNKTTQLSKRFHDIMIMFLDDRNILNERE